MPKDNRSGDAVQRGVRHSLIVVPVLALVVAAATGAQHMPVRLQSCTMSASDQEWIERSVSAWRWAMPDIAGVERTVEIQALLFSADCLLVSRTALISTGAPSWRSIRHDGTIKLPDGDRLPAGVASFTRVDGERAWFVMSTPSVWRAAGVPGGPLGLETLMTAVLLHEGVHVLQFPTYGARVSALIERCAFPESFNDDSIQERFEDDEEFASSVEREMELFFAVHDAPDVASASALAREARSLMQTRHDRWFVGEDACLREAEDLWLTLEGTGQWVGHEWLLHDDGAGVTPEATMSGFGRRSRWWSQNLGLALVRALHRLDAGIWRYEAFGAGERTVIQMLDAVLDAIPEGPGTPPLRNRAVVHDELLNSHGRRGGDALAAARHGGIP